jgi:hypothetical protein
MMLPKGLMMFLYSECGYNSLLFEELKVGIVTISLFFFGECCYSGRV